MSDNINNNNSPAGDVIISNEVLATIALNSIKDIEGVSGLAQKSVSFPQLLNFSSESVGKSIKLFVTDNDVKIQLFINLKAGYKIPTVAEKIQSAVKEAVQSMTGKIVSKVDVTVVNIDFTESDAQEQGV